MSVQSSQAAGVPAPHNNRHRNEDNNHNENLHRHNDNNNHAHYVRFLFLTNDESYIDEKLYYSSELCSIYIVYIYIYIYIYLMCWLQERQISNVANSHSVCVLFMCVSTVNLYVYIILIFYIVATELSIY